jgi:hypothetical protein
MPRLLSDVIPAQAGIHLEASRTYPGGVFDPKRERRAVQPAAEWTPAFAGATK